MKVIILAAGTGNRLLPLTKNKPKALIEVDNRPLLYYQLESLQNMNLDEIYIVTGHCSELIEKFVSSSCTIIKNEKYNSTNNMYSLWLMKDKINEEFILINSDVLFHETILDKIIKSKFKNSIVIDVVKKLGEEEMKVILDNNKLVRIGKDINPIRATGEYIGISKFSRKGAEILFNKIDELIKQKNVNELYEKAFYDIVNRLDIHGVSTDGLPWIEIDNFADLKNASTIISQMQQRRDGGRK